MITAGFGLLIAVASVATGVESSPPSQPLRGWIRGLFSSGSPRSRRLSLRLGSRSMLAAGCWSSRATRTFRPAGLSGAAGRSHPGVRGSRPRRQPECTGTFFEGTQKTMNLPVARDDSVFVATRSALYRLWDRDGDGKADGMSRGNCRHRSSDSIQRATIRTTGFRVSRLTMPAMSTSAWARTWERLPPDRSAMERHSPAAAKGVISIAAGPTARSSSTSPPGSGTRFTSRSTSSAGCSRSTTTPTRALPAGLLHIVEGATMATGFATGGRGCTLSQPGTASCQARCGWLPAQARHLRVLSPTSQSTFLTTIGVRCWSLPGATIASNSSASSRGAQPFGRHEAGRRSAATTSGPLALRWRPRRLALYQRLGRQVIRRCTARDGSGGFAARSTAARATGARPAVHRHAAAASRSSCDRTGRSRRQI